MPVAADSYMGVFMPADISRRISLFIADRHDFPIVKKGELMGSFYLFGKDYGVPTVSEARDASDIARKAVEQVAKDVRLYSSNPAKMAPAFTRENYTKRSLQIAVDNAGSAPDMDKRVAGDPAILSDCFAQHVAYHKQGYFFELFQPLNASDLPQALKKKLEARMLLLGFNVPDRQSLPFKSTLEPFFEWMLKQKHSG